MFPFIAALSPNLGNGIIAGLMGTFVCSWGAGTVVSLTYFVFKMMRSLYLCPF